MRSGWEPDRALGADGFMSSIGCSGNVIFWLHLYADSPFTYAIRPECSAGLAVIKRLGWQRCWGIRVDTEFKLKRLHAM